MRNYKPKRDSWLALIFLSGPAVVMGVALPLLQSGRLFNTVDGWLLLGVNAFVLALLGWLWFGTGYALADNALQVRCGPMRQRIPLANIRYVRPCRSLMSAPALSVRRLHIGIQNGRVVDELPIAPADQARFIADLQQRCPDLIVHGGGQ